MVADMAVVQAIATKYQDIPGGLLPALHAVQDSLGWVPDQALPVLASCFGMSRAEVYGVVTYYHHFRSHPAGRHTIEICRAEACQACGAEELLAHVEASLDCRHGEIRSDGEVSVHAVYCLGLCASSPAVKIDDELHARMSRQELDPLLSKIGGMR